MFCSKVGQSNVLVEAELCNTMKCLNTELHLSNRNSTQVSGSQAISNNIDVSSIQLLAEEAQENTENFDESFDQLTFNRSLEEEQTSQFTRSVQDTQGVENTVQENNSVDETTFADLRPRYESLLGRKSISRPMKAKEAQKRKSTSMVVFKALTVGNGFSKCSTCGHISSMSGLARHVCRLSKSGVAYICSQCGKSCRSPSGLSNHMKIHQKSSESLPAMEQHPAAAPSDTLPVHKVKRLNHVH